MCRWFSACSAVVNLELEPGSPDGGGHGRRRGPEGADGNRRAFLPGGRAGDQGSAAERPELHRPRLPAAGCDRLPSPRRRLGGGARRRRIDQRSRPAFERLSARRHSPERLHQRPGRAVPRARRSGTETVREFRVETNSYSAEYGRNFGGQILVATKSGGNDVDGQRLRVSPQRRPRRAQLLRSGRQARFHAQPVRRRPSAVRSRKTRRSSSSATRACARTSGEIVSTVVPDENARQGLLPDPAQPVPVLRNVGVSPAVKPVSRRVPAAQRRLRLGAVSPSIGFPSIRPSTRTSSRPASITTCRPKTRCSSATPATSPTSTCPPTFPQFPRTFLSTNQFLTARIATRGFGFDASHPASFMSNTQHRPDRRGESRASPLPPFVAGPAADGRHRHRRHSGTFRSADLGRPRHQAGCHRRRVFVRAVARLAPHQGRAPCSSTTRAISTTRPSASASTPSATSKDSCATRPTRFVGLTPEASLVRLWKFTLMGAYLQDEYPRLRPLLRSGRSPLRDDDPSQGRRRPRLHPGHPERSRRPTLGLPYGSSPKLNFSPRVSFAWDVKGDGKLAVRGGYGLYFNVNNQQNLIVTITNPPVTPRADHREPDVPSSLLSPARPRTRSGPCSGISQNPRAHVYNLNVQKELWGNTVLTVGYAGSRGMHLLRSGDVNVPTPELASRRHGLLFGDRSPAEHGLRRHRAEDERRRVLVQRAASSTCATPRRACGSRPRTPWPAPSTPPRPRRSSPTRPTAPPRRSPSPSASRPTRARPISTPPTTWF